MLDPEARQQFLSLVRDNIADYGWHLTAVLPRADTPEHEAVPWAYTTGLFQSFSHAEIAVFGVTDDFAQALIELVVERIRAGSAFHDGDQAEQIVRDYPVAFRQIVTHDPTWPMSVSNVFYGYEYPALQMVLPDRHGRFPWHPGVDLGMRFCQTLIQDFPQ